MSQHTNVGTVNRMTQAVLEQDKDTLSKIFTEDLTFHLRGPYDRAGDYNGVAGLLEAIGSIVEATNGDVQLDQLFCLGADGWAAEFEVAALGRNGRKLASKNAFVYRFEGERIAEMWMFLGCEADEAAAFFA